MTTLSPSYPWSSRNVPRERMQSRHERWMCRGRNGTAAAALRAAHGVYDRPASRPVVVVHAPPRHHHLTFASRPLLVVVKATSSHTAIPLVYCRHRVPPPAVAPPQQPPAASPAGGTARAPACTSARPVAVEATSPRPREPLRVRVELKPHVQDAPAARPSSLAAAPLPSALQPRAQLIPREPLVARNVLHANPPRAGVGVSATAVPSPAPRAPSQLAARSSPTTLQARNTLHCRGQLAARGALIARDTFYADAPQLEASALAPRPAPLRTLRAREVLTPRGARVSRHEVSVGARPSSQPRAASALQVRDGLQYRGQLVARDTLVACTTFYADVPTFSRSTAKEPAPCPQPTPQPRAMLVPHGELKSRHEAFMAARPSATGATANLPQARNVSQYRRQLVARDTLVARPTFYADVAEIVAPVVPYALPVEQLRARETLAPRGKLMPQHPMCRTARLSVRPVSANDLQARDGLQCRGQLVARDTLVARAMFYADVPTVATPAAPCVRSLVASTSTLRARETLTRRGELMLREERRSRHAVCVAARPSPGGASSNMLRARDELQCRGQLVARDTLVARAMFYKDVPQVATPVVPCVQPRLVKSLRARGMLMPRERLTPRHEMCVAGPRRATATMLKPRGAVARERLVARGTFYADVPRAARLAGGRGAEEDVVDVGADFFDCSCSDHTAEELMEDAVMVHLTLHMEDLAPGDDVDDDHPDDWVDVLADPETAAVLSPCGHAPVPPRAASPRRPRPTAL